MSFYRKGFHPNEIDDGALIEAGWKGVMYSAPELVFVNVRKGTFPFVGGVRLAELEEGEARADGRSPTR